jgi:thiosulfate dehydrogenase
MEKPYDYIRTINALVRVITTIVLFVVLILLIITYKMLAIHIPLPMEESSKVSQNSLHWVSPPLSSIPKTKTGKLILHGRELILHTEKFLGPKGITQKDGNGMRCTNCHLDAGTKTFGNNFSAVASTYPKFRPRYGAIESIEKRVNDCIVRSLHGKALDSASSEMRAIVAYIVWLGKDVPKGIAPEGSGLLAVPFLERPADPEKGKTIYSQKCAHCHGENGEGMVSKGSSSYLNPPVWGKYSYTVGAGMHRLGHLAAFVKTNMPWGVSYDAPQLTDEQAWDVAAYINSMPRPEIDLNKDWPDISKKPIDYPFGPFVDRFSEEQHKYGPYKAMLKMQETSTSLTRKN